MESQDRTNSGLESTSQPKREQLAITWGQGEKARFDKALEEAAARVGRKVTAREFILEAIDRAASAGQSDELAARLKELGINQLLEAHYQRRVAEERLLMTIADTMETIHEEKKKAETDLLNADIELLNLKTAIAAAASKDDQLRQWEQQVRELNWKIGQLEPALADERARRVELEQKALSAISERDEARAELTRLISALEETTKRINELEAKRTREKEMACARLDELTSTLEKERVTLAETARESLSVVSERDSAVIEAAHLKVERDTARNDVERLTAQLTEMRGEVEAKQADIVDVRTALIEAREAVAAAEAKAAAQSETIAALREALATVRAFNVTSEAVERPVEARKEEKQKGKGNV